MELENLNPNVYRKLENRKSAAIDFDESVEDPFDEREIFGEWVVAIATKRNRNNISNG